MGCKDLGIRKSECYGKDLISEHTHNSPHKNINI